MKTYTMIAGVNGAGKSSLTGVLKKQMHDLGRVIDPDNITASLCGGDEYEGGKLAVEKIEACLAEGVNFTQETTLSGGYTKKVVKTAKEQNYYIRMFYVGLDTAEESLSRIKNRVAKGGHNIPEKDVLRRFDKRFETLVKILPFCDEITFYDNDNGFSAVGEYQNGTIFPLVTVPPRWFKELMEALE